MITLMLIGIFFTMSYGTPDDIVFTGKYDVNAGTHMMVLFIIQNGNTIYGTYDVPQGSGNFGYITGTVKGNRAEFTYIEVIYGEKRIHNSGSGYLVMDADNKGFMGSWKDKSKTYSGNWTGKRIY